MPSSSDHNLLFGIIALQMDFVRREQLVAATSTWLTDKSRQIEEILVAQGALNEADRQLLAPLVTRHLDNHGGDPQQSLTALSSIGSVVDELRLLGDEGIEATLSLVVSDRPSDAQEETTVHESKASRAPAGSSSHRTSDARFRILRSHAKGGLGEVYVARDTELNREVAVKEIHTQRADDEASRLRFLLEAEVTGGLEHPGIVPVYGLGRYENGRPFYAMRFIKGDSLQEAADRFHQRHSSADRNDRQSPAPEFNGLEFRKLLGRFIDVCQAIEYAHSRGVLHRDLKPGNIMLGKYGETLVVDWGLAKTTESADQWTGDNSLLVPSSASGSVATMMGSAIGTPAYMPPEQAAGDLDELGPASDVYSLGATLYYMLTGRPPTAGTTPSILKVVQEGRVPSPRSILSAIPKPLEAICRRAMMRDPDDRYPRPAALAEDVEQYLADEPVGAYAEPLAIRFRRWLRKHRTVAVTSVVVVLITVVGLTIFSSIVSNKNSLLTELNSKLDSRNVDLKSANAELVASNLRADAEARLARTAEGRERQQRARAEHALYLSDLRLAARYSEDGKQDLSYERLLAHLPIGGDTDRRGWEWHYLLGRSVPSLASWSASPFNVAAISWSADSKLLGTADYGGRVVSWHAETGEEVFSNRDGGTIKTAVAWHPTEQRLAWGCAVTDPHIRVYDMKTKELSLLAGDMGSHRFLRWSPSGDRLAVGAIKIKQLTKAATLGVWKRTDKGWHRVAERRIPFGVGVDGVEWSPSGKKLLVVGRSVRTWVVDPESLEILKQSPDRGYLSAAWHPTEQRLACGGPNGGIIILDAKTMKLQKRFSGHLGGVTSVAWSPDGKSLATGSADHSVKVWDGEQYDLVGRYLGHSAVVNQVSWRPDSERLASCGYDGRVNVWPRRDASSLAHPNSIVVGRTSQVSAELPGRRGFVWIDEGTIRTCHTPEEFADLDVRTGEIKARHALPAGQWQMLSASRAGRFGGNAGTAVIDVNAETPDKATIKGGQYVWVDDKDEDFVAFCRKGSITGKFVIGQLSSDREVPLGDASMTKIREMCWSPNQKWIAAVGGGIPSDGGTEMYAGWVNLFNRETGELVSRARIGNSRIVGLSGAWSPDSTRFVAGNLDGVCQIYAAPSLRTQLVKRLHRLRVYSLNWHPTQPRIASSSADRTVKVWDAETGDVLLTFPMSSPVVHVSWSPDGQRLVAMDTRGRLHVWAAESGLKLASGNRLRRRLKEQLQSEVYSSITAGDYNNALALSQKILSLNHELGWRHYYHVALLAAELDQPAVTKASVANLLAAHGDSSKVNPAYHAVWAAVLSPDTLEDYGKVIQVARRLSDSDPDDRQLRVVLAAALLRSGEFADARIQLDLAGKAKKKTQGSPAFLFYFLALTEFRLNHVQLAKRHQAEGDRLCDKELATNPHWFRKLSLNVLRRQVAELNFSAASSEPTDSVGSNY